MNFTFFDINNAPQSVREELQKSEQAFGFVPNLHKVLAASPSVLTAYKFMHKQFLATSLDATEKTVVWQTINLYNQCHYCLPAHTGIAHMMDVDDQVIAELQTGRPLSDSKLRVLQETTKAIVDQHGKLTDEQLQTFEAAGYTSAQLIEILLGLSQKILSNYTNYFAKTPVDEPFQQYITE